MNPIRVPANDMPPHEQPAAVTFDKPLSIYETPSRMQKAVKWFRQKIGRTPAENNLKEIISDALEDLSDAGAAISADEKDLLENMIHFGELTVKDIMMPRSDIMAVRHDVSWEELRQHVIEIGHTRLPVFEDNLDRVLGFIHVKDLFMHLSAEKSFVLAQVMREILFVPPSMRIVDLLVKMRVSGCHMAIVVDEYGGTDGLVTMEDLIEELVGEIQDEHDDAQSVMLQWIGNHTIDADARVRIEDVETALGQHLIEPKEGGDYDTLGGFIFSYLGRVPVKGEVVQVAPNLKFEIVAADARRIRQVRITRSGESPAPSGV